MKAKTALVHIEAIFYRYAWWSRRYRAAPYYALDMRV